MANYYYTIATLPFFSYDLPSQISTGEFLSLAAEWMAPSAYKVLTEAKLDISSQKEGEVPSFLRPWYRFERTLRNALVKMRAAKLGADGSRYLREGNEDTGIDEIIREVSGQSTPLLAEDVLNRARWRKLEELEVGHYFDLQRLMIIYLKIQLLERKKLFREELGRAQFEEIYAEVREAVAEASTTGNGVG